MGMGIPIPMGLPWDCHGNGSSFGLLTGNGNGNSFNRNGNSILYIRKIKFPCTGSVNSVLF